MALGNNAMPSWMLNPKFKKATSKYSAGELSQEEVYEKIKYIEEIPDRVKDNWNPDTEV